MKQKYNKKTGNGWIDTQYNHNTVTIEEMPQGEYGLQLSENQIFMIGMSKKQLLDLKEALETFTKEMKIKRGK